MKSGGGHVGGTLGRGELKVLRRAVSHQNALCKCKNFSLINFVEIKQKGQNGSIITGSVSS